MDKNDHSSAADGSALSSGQAAPNASRLASRRSFLQAGGAATLTLLYARPHSASGAATPDLSIHPRLFFSRDEIPALRKKVKQGTPKWMYDALTGHCRDLVATINLDDRRWAEAADQKSNWSDARDILDLSVAYAISGDASYRDMALALLMKVCAWPTLRVGYEPNRAVLLQAVAIAYDTLHAELGPDRARKVAAKIAFECEDMSKFLMGTGRESIGRISSMAPRTYAPFGVAAIAIKGEYPKADEWIGLARESVPRWVDGALDDDGGFYYSSEACYNTLALNYVLGFYVAWRRLRREAGRYAQTA